MRTDRLAWSQVACDNLKKAGATDEIFYYRRVLGKEKYAAHVFIAQYASQEQLKQHWESLNDNIALLYQSNVDSLLERSNFYLCFFLPESLDIIEKEKIENDAYCAKKYIFVSKKELSIEEKIRKINEKIFELTYLEPQDTSETKLISMQVQNFRIYKGQKNFAFTAENSPDCPASLVMIYAPNGMGKTSICDALEWALTGRIQRLSDMEKLIGRSNMLLHNREKYKSVEEYRRNKEYALVKLVLRNRAGAQDELQRVVRRNACWYVQRNARRKGKAFSERVTLESDHYATRPNRKICERDKTVRPLQRVDDMRRSKRHSSGAIQKEIHRIF